ncbi:MAG: hypothetical protein ACTSQJ_04425 [Promethearchaeota archaeon]
MDKQRILREAQKIAAKFSFWMVSGNIAHLYGYAYETPEVKYELEIKFDENFPNTPPQFIYRDAIKELIGDFQLSKLNSWTPESNVVDILHELKAKIQEALSGPTIIEEQDLIPITHPTSEDKTEYITPDINAYPPEYPIEEYITPSLETNEHIIYSDTSKSVGFSAPTTPTNELSTSSYDELTAEPDQTSVAANTELGLVQQEYAYDQRTKKTDINVYITITLTKTFIVSIDFTNYPEKPIFNFPEEIKALLGNPYQTLKTLKSWNPKKAPHIVDVLRELETKLFFIKDIELESKKILGEYQADKVSNSVTELTVHLLTYGFKEYFLNIDLGSYPKQPIIKLTPELQNIIQIPVESLNSYKNWKEKESEPVEILREISWLVDKNSRINFEIELLKANYKNINYNASTATINVEMKGKMKTQDINFQFQIKLPREYPMKTPEIKVLNEFELETHEKIKNDLQSSFSNFFNEWTPFSYLVDLFNVISEKIFEVSVVSCVICHKIECPSCGVKIAGSESCHVECPYCERAYHKHCWDQTISSFGKCGFCLKTPPPSMMP